MDLQPLGVARPERGGCLNHARGARRILEHRGDDVFRFDLMKRRQLPIAEDLGDAAHKPEQNVYLMDRLVDKRASAFGGPASFNGARVIRGGAKPFDVGVGLKKLAPAATVEGT